MNALQLLMPDGSPSNQWFCSTCRHVRSAQDIAERCCRCSECGEECIAGKDGNYTGLHRTCSAMRDQRILEKRLAEATEVPPPVEGMVYSDEYRGDQEGYFRDVDDFMEMYCDEPEGLRPEFVFCTTSEVPRLRSADRLVSAMAEDLWEDAFDDFAGIAELQVAIDAFNEKNKSLRSFNTDYKRKIRIPWPATEVESPE